MAEQQCQQWLAQFLTSPPIAFDSWSHNPASAAFLMRKAFFWAPWAGGEVALATGRERLDKFAQRLKAEHLAAIKAGQTPAFQTTTITFKGTTETYYTYCRTHRLHNLASPSRHQLSSG
ncbi:MAG: hypothetical protein IPM39_13410 [Chloroflexi bacterium]|nr:hypothetical protein [Chloroflexota bacterium]